MKALSLHQPWATAVVIGIKKNETRGWQTKYRGPLAIHAAKHIDNMQRWSFENLTEWPEISIAFHKAGFLHFEYLPLGAIIGEVNLVDILPVKGLRVSDTERALGNYNPGRFAWILQNPIRYAKPIPVRGYQQIFEVDIPTDLRKAA